MGGLPRCTVFVWGLDVLLICDARCRCLTIWFAAVLFASGCLVFSGNLTGSTDPTSSTSPEHNARYHSGVENGTVVVLLLD